MNYDLLFSVINIVVIPFWLMMFAFPRADWVAKIIRSPLIIVPPAIIYTLLIVFSFMQNNSMSFDAFMSLDGVTGLITSPAGVTTVWAHLLTFDLMTGRWIYLDALDRKMQSWVVMVPLVLTFLLGPIGLLLYLVFRASTVK
jgi:hypothetical protein